MDKEGIKNLIAKGRIDKALDFLIESVNQIEDVQTKNDLILQSNRLKRILREKNLGIESSENINITTNQIVNGVLSMIDEVDNEIHRSKEMKGSAEYGISEGELLVELSLIVGQKVNAIPPEQRNAIVHQVELYRINKQNLELAEKALAKWGELAPPVILHRINDEQEKINQIINRLKILL
jgi:hypothetical protein